MQTFIVFPNIKQGGHVKFLVDPDITPMCPNPWIGYAAVAIWEISGDRETNIKVPHTLTMAQCKAIPVSAVFWAWSGLYDALMFDVRIAGPLRNRLMVKHSDLLQHRIRRMKDDRQIGEVQHYLDSMRNFPLNQLPELPLTEGLHI